MGVQEVFEQRLCVTLSLACAQHQEVMEGASQVEEEARFH